ncbi:MULTISPECIES: hypothetical protein [unclassified Thermosipho (in: thermotogales)]|uniref:hypothetical protein n=1 Tax=unclassified Thermosipho (in: thermotogales) TaxID=2676525 RepID=UPI0009860A38|nr:MULTISPECIES: hypothetical protein [unclassified Thermosipho (in: thermotogales)]MBT1248484.1 hypothetical protein [Thermosipho sp. 1244]OOC47255.1 hypothetical protein XO09_02345 [Thermosipho sp. 1223]
MRKFLLFAFLMFSLFSFSEMYSIKIGETLLGTSVLNEKGDVYTTKTIIDYGMLYTIDSTTVFVDNLFKDYIVTFTVDGSYTGRIIGKYDGKVAKFIFETLQSSYTYTLNKENLFIMDNNFVLSHLKRILDFPSPYFNVVIPQLLFNPSKTEYAVENVSLKKKGEIFELNFRDESIKITYHMGNITRIEYPGHVVVELID